MEEAARGNIVLVGFMGTGKSAVGRLLARRLRRPFMDTDAWVEAEAGMSVAALFAEFGEAAFREMETRAAREAARRRNLVVATGGGILGREENVALLRSSGVLVALQARPDVILARTAPWESRPLLSQAEDPRALVERLLAERAPRYALADCAIDTSDRSPAEVAEEICARLPSLWESARTRF